MGPCVRRDDICKYLLQDQTTQVAPIDVLFLDQLNFPLPFPPLYLLLSLDAVVGRFNWFDVHRPVDVVLVHELRTATKSMLPHPSAQIVRDSNVQASGAA